MELARRRVKAPADGRPIHLYPLGDIHLGAAACDIEDFRKTVKQIAADPNGYWIGMGDYGDLILPTDDRWRISTHDWKRLGYRNGRPDPGNLGDEYREMIFRELDPIAPKCLGIHEGNHETTMREKYFVDIPRLLAQRFNAPYLGYTALTRLEVEITRGEKDHGRLWAITIFSEHGATGGGSDGNSLNSLQKRAAEWSADIYLRGHVHKLGVSQRTEYGWAPNRISTRDRIFVLTGTYLKGYPLGITPYSELKAYAPNEIGGAVVRLNPRLQRMAAMTTSAHFS